MLTKYQTKDIFFKRADVIFSRILMKKDKLISYFFDFQPEQKNLKNQEEESGQGFQSVTKILKKMIICI